MDKADILFLHPRIKKVSTSYRSLGSPPIGLAYLAAISEKEGYESKFLDLNMQQHSQSRIADYIEWINPTVIALSFVTEARFEAFKILKLAKRMNPDMVTIAGGPHATLCADDCLKNVRELDIIVRGEGEETFAELMGAVIQKNRDLSVIKGLSYRENGNIKHNKNRPPIKALDSLPFPALHLLSFDQYDFKLEVPGYGPLRAAPVLSSRGCPFSCNFCATTKVWGAKWRFRSTENIMAEVELLKKRYGVEAIWFVDDNFNANSKRVMAVCEELIKRYLDLKWICNIRVDNIKEKHLKSMAAAGCISVEFGAESGSQRILDEIINKGITTKQIVDVDRWCTELGIVTDAQFIISHPTETLDEAKETINLMKSLKGKSTLQILKIYPGTEIENIAIQKGILPEGFSWSTHKGDTDYVPSILGEVPLFLDRLTMDQVSELMTIAWTEIGSFSLFFLVKKILAKIRSSKELFTLLKLGLPILIRKFRDSIARSKA